MKPLFQALVLLALLSCQTLAAERPVIEKKDDLPRHTYSVDLAVNELYRAANRDKLLQLAAAVERDVRADLTTYDIRDDNTVQGFYSLLGTIAALQGHWGEYLELLDKRRELEPKEANRLTSARRFHRWPAAPRAQADPGGFPSAR